MRPLLVGIAVWLGCGGGGGGGGSTACPEGTCVCGDGITDAGEACDDANQVGGDGCASDCTSDETCGNSIVDVAVGEACDGGATNANTPDASCRMNCQPIRCGDGVVDSDEACDDGNDVPGDGCSADCGSTEVCGNGIIDATATEACDDGTANSDTPNASCRTNCQLPQCGDAIADDATEVCDDGGDQSGDGCSADCLSDETCGNHYVDSATGEGCDDAGPAGLAGDGCSSTCVGEGRAWSVQTMARWSHATAFDAARGRLVVFGGSNSNYHAETWEWDGSRWSRQFPLTSPPPRAMHSMAYDAVRQRVVLFGGWSASVAGQALGDTWEWDGVTWTQIMPTVSPPARRLGALAYDVARARIVLFGGFGFTDTWEYDGSTWVNKNPSVSPPYRYNHTVAYDVARSRLVMFGGKNGNALLNDTWEWDGTNWTGLTPTVSPSARQAHAMAYDPNRQRVLLFGGANDSFIPTVYGDTWEWDGANWSQSAPVRSPAARATATLTYDVTRGRAVLFGGIPGGSLAGAGGMGDTWLWDGQDWLEQEPVGRDDSALVYDAKRARVMLFGGVDGTGTALDDSWEWDAVRWIRRSPSTAPPPRSSHAMAYDSDRGRTVLFGGTSGSGYRGDTWEWTGADWTPLTPSSSPPARRSHVLVYDLSRNLTVLYGGVNAGGYLADTWEWDGVTWTQKTPVTSPPARAYHAAAFDAARGRVVLFGGLGTMGALADTWDWDGSNWVKLTPMSSPSARSRHAAAYHFARGRVVVVGGRDAASADLSDTWEWNGTAWNTLNVGALVRSRHALAYFSAPAGPGVVTFGRNGSLEPAHRLRFVSIVSPPDLCESSTDTDADGLLGCADPDCWYRCEPECPAFTTCEAGRERCGDGVCNAMLEDTQICPADCP